MNLRALLFIGAIICIILGEIIGYELSISDAENNVISVINENYDCVLRNNFNISVGGINIAGTNKSNNNNT